MKEGNPMVEEEPCHPSGFPYFSQFSRVLGSVSVSLALDTKLNLTLASGSSGLRSGCTLNDAFWKAFLMALADGLSAGSSPKIVYGLNASSWCSSTGAATTMASNTAQSTTNTMLDLENPDRRFFFTGLPENSDTAAPGSRSSAPQHRSKSRPRPLARVHGNTILDNAANINQ